MRRAADVLQQVRARCGVVAPAVVCVAALAWPAGATVLLPVEFGDMVAGSQLIVHGRVTDVRAQTTSGRRSIESVVTMTVTEALKGQPGDTVVFRVPGGQIGRYRRVMVGAPRLAEGDEVVVFLAGRAPAMPMPFGLGQGLYRVARSLDGRALVAPPPVLASGMDAERVVRGDPARRPLAIEMFARQVRAELERAR